MFDQLTEQDIQKMKEEVEYRKLVVRKEALEAVKEARAHGDLSENFEYKAAKKFKIFVLHPSSSKKITKSTPRDAKRFLKFRPMVEIILLASLATFEAVRRTVLCILQNTCLLANILALYSWKMN